MTDAAMTMSFWGCLIIFHLHNRDGRKGWAALFMAGAVWCLVRQAGWI